MKSPLALAICFCPVLLALAGEPAAAPARVVKVENEGLLFTDNHAGVSGVDGYFSLPVGGNMTAWFFGDAFLLDPTSPEKQWVGDVSNCALLTPSGRGYRGLSKYHFLTRPTNGVARQVIANRPDENNSTRFWPLAGFHDERQRAIFLYYLRVQFTNGAGPLDFKVVGYGLARSDGRDPGAMQFERVKDAEGGEIWQRSESGPLFGSAVVAGAPGTNLYVLGYRERIDHPAVLARVPKRRIGDSRAYEYFSGTAASPAWSRDARDAKDLAGLGNMPAVLSVVYNQYLGGYLAVHHVGTSEKIRLCLAKEPWGPYEPVGEITAPHKAFAKSFCYDGAEHPELAEENGRVIYVTFVDSDRYWQQLYRVTLQKGK